jgi:hypothetical protein
MAAKSLSKSERAKLLKATRNALTSFEYCYAELSRHGRLQVYFWRGKGHPKVRIREEPNTQEFMAAYWAIRNGQALSGQMAALGLQRQPVSSAPLALNKAKIGNGVRTLGWLIDQYQASNEWKAYKKPTKSSRGNIFKLIRQEPHPIHPGYSFEDCPLDKFTTQYVKHLRDSRIKWVVQRDEEVIEAVEGEMVAGVAADADDLVQVATNKESANSWLKAIRALFKWAVNDSHLGIHENPCLPVALYGSSKDGFHCWTPQEITIFRERYPVGTKERLAMELLLFTLQRRSDVVQMGRQWLKEDSKGRPTFKFTQRKNKGTDRETKAVVPYFPELRAIVEATPGVGDMVFLLSEHRKPFKPESFTNWFRDVCDKAGLPDCSAHGLRKAGVVELIRLEYRREQIMAITGHTTAKEFDRYARTYAREHGVEQLVDDWLEKNTA